MITKNQNTKINRILSLVLAVVLALSTLSTFQIYAQIGEQSWQLCDAIYTNIPHHPEIAPHIGIEPMTDWNPTMPLPNRPITATELLAWNAQYCEQGRVTDFEREILYLTNIERAANDLPPLVLNYALSRAARFKSQETLDLNYFGHVSPVYGAFQNIPLLFVNEYQALGENLFALSNWQIADITAELIVQGWMGSDGHRANILNPNFSELGIGVDFRPPMGVVVNNAMATQMFGHGVVDLEHCICTQNANSVAVSLADDQGEPGDYIDVVLSLDANPGLIGLQLDIDFDRSILTAIGATPGTLMPLPTPPTFPIPANLPLGLTFEAADFENIYGIGELATIRFRINPTADDGATAITMNGIMAMSGKPDFEMFDIAATNAQITIGNGGDISDGAVSVLAVDNSGAPGSYVDVVFYLDENPGLIGLQIDVDFDRDILTAISMTNGAIMPLPTPPTFPIPANLPLGLTFEAADFENIYATGELITIRFRIDANADPGTTTIAIDGIMAMSGEPDFEMFDISTTNALITITDGGADAAVRVSASHSRGVPGDYINVAISLDENPGLIGFQIDIDFNRAMLTAISVTPGTLMPLPTPPTFPIPPTQALGLTFEAAGFAGIYDTGELATIRFRIEQGASGAIPITITGIMAMGGEPNYNTYEIFATNALVTIGEPIAANPTITVTSIESTIADQIGAYATFWIYLTNMSPFDPIQVMSVGDTSGTSPAGSVIIEVEYLPPGIRIRANEFVAYRGNGMGDGPMTLEVYAAIGLSYFNGIVSQFAEIFATNTPAETASHEPTTPTNNTPQSNNATTTTLPPTTTATTTPQKPKSRT